LDDHGRLAWLAGWLEGEGSFCFNGSFRVRGYSNDRGTLEWLKQHYGGNIYGYSRTPQRIEWQWVLNGQPAEAMMQSIYPFMSPRRRHQIEAALGRRKWEGWHE
jgi:hypothetical protein